MMTVKLRPALLFVLLLAAIVALGRVHWTAPFYLEISMQSALGGTAQLYYDVGRGLNEADSTRIPITAGDQFILYRFPLPAGTIKNLRFDPTDRGGGLQHIRRTHIVDRAGNTVREFSFENFIAAQEIKELRVGAEGLEIGTALGSYDPILAVHLDDKLTLQAVRKAAFIQFMRVFALGFTIFLLLGLAYNPIISFWRLTAVTWMTLPTAWARQHPGWAICLTAALAAVWSCYPIVFCGKSFVSPNNHSSTFLLYAHMPTLPGYNDVTTDDEKGSDLGAMMWYDVPTTAVESDAVRHDRELPLWNRYNSTGLPLLGQGQSMFGDPLHAIVLLMGATSGWWDFKFVVAKWFFAACIGLSILLASRHLGAAMLLAASAPFLGFFSYRYSHPAFFSFCYAPAVFLCWLLLASAKSRRQAATFLFLLAGANWMLMCSGTVKEAYMQLLGMNVAGTLILLFAEEAWSVKLRKLGGVILAGVLFVGLSAPLWWSFLRALGGSRTAYDSGGVFQLQPGLFVGLFDDIFYRQFNSAEIHLDPSANFLVLLGIAWLAGRWCCSRGDSSPTAGALTLCAVGTATLVFGVIPPAWVMHLPFIKQIIHIDNTFSCVLLVYLLLLAGYGIKDFCNTASLSTQFWRPYAFSMLVILGLLGAYFGTTQAAQRSTLTFLHVNEAVPLSPFFKGYVLTLVLAVMLLPWLGRRLLLVKTPAPITLLSLIAAFALLHWRHGMYLTTRFDPYVMNPHERVNLAAHSPALDFIHAQLGEPARCVGFGNTLFPGYSDIIKLESIDGPDALFDPAYRELMEAAQYPLPYDVWRFQINAQTFRAESPVLNLLNVRYYLDDPYTSASDTELSSLKKVGTFDLNVYESKGFWPRAFFADKIVTYDGDAKQFTGLAKSGDGTPFVALKQADLATHPSLVPLLAELGSARRIVPATNYRQTTNTTELEVVAPSAGVLTLTELFVGGDVHARVNGKPAECFRVNHAFRGVYLDAPGVYRLQFTYWPRHFSLTLWASALSLIVMGSLWWATRAQPFAKIPADAA